MKQNSQLCCRYRVKICTAPTGKNISPSVTTTGEIQESQFDPNGNNNNACRSGRLIIVFFGEETQESHVKPSSNSKRVTCRSGKLVTCWLRR